MHLCLHLLAGISASIASLAFLFRTMASSDTASVVGRTSRWQPGDIGYRAPWVAPLCKIIGGNHIMGLLEDALGNLAAHEMMLLIAAHDR